MATKDYSHAYYQGSSVGTPKFGLMSPNGPKGHFFMPISKGNGWHQKITG